MSVWPKQIMSHASAHIKMVVVCKSVHNSTHLYFEKEVKMLLSVCESTCIQFTEWSDGWKLFTSETASYYACTHSKTNITFIGRPIRHTHMALLLWNNTWQHMPTRLQQGSSGFTRQNWWHWSQVSSSATAYSPLSIPFPLHCHHILSTCACKTT